MKRLMLVWVMVLCIMLSCNVAQAVDWNLYALPDQSDGVRYTFFPNREEVYWSRSEECWLWIRGGEEIARLTELSCPGINTSTQFEPIPGGRLAVLFERITEGEDERGLDDQISWVYGIWTPDTFTQIREWFMDDSSRGALSAQGIFIGEITGNAALYDLDGQELWSGIFSGGYPRELDMRSYDDWSIATLGPTGLNAFKCCRYWQGKQIWTLDTIGYTNPLLLEDGWTLLTEYGTDGKNGPTYLRLIDPNGHVAVSRQVTADRLSVTCRSPFVDRDGHVVIYGSAVGNRRRIYQCWKLTLDRQMNLISLDVRECRYHDCYSIDIFRDGEDGVRIHLSDNRDDGEQAPDILVPFEELPPAANHTLQYVWGSPSGGDMEDWGDK